MVQQFVQAVYRATDWLVEVLQASAPWIVLLAGFAALLVLVFYLRAKEDFERFWGAVSPRLVAAGAVALALLLLALGVFLLNSAVDAVLESREVEAMSPYASGEEAPVGTLYQYGPVAAHLREQTYTRDYLLPVQVVQLPMKGGTPVAQALLPYLQEQVAYTAKAPEVEVSVRRVGEEWVVTRKVTMLEEVPITMERAEVNARFRTRRGDRGRSVYQLHFTGQYAFRNSLNSDIRARFVFPIPEPPGTIEGFQLKVGEQVVTEPTPEGLYAWEGTLRAGEATTAVAQFQATVGSGWFYDIGSGRRRTGDFRLVVESDSPPRLLRGSLAPTERRGRQTVWHLQNVITSQSVSLGFPADTTGHETMVKVLRFYPVALMVYGAWGLLLALLGVLRVSAIRWLLSVPGVGVGFFLVPVLLNYVTIGWAALVGSAVAIGLGLFMLQGRHAPLVLLSAALPLAFLVVDHSALLLAITVLAGFISLWWDVRHRWSL